VLFHGTEISVLRGNEGKQTRHWAWDEGDGSPHAQHGVGVDMASVILLVICKYGVGEGGCMCKKDFGSSAAIFF
jgi:hypothetical protein